MRQTIERNPIDPARVFVCGLSAGGAMSAILAEQAPDLFAAAGVMAGVSLHTSFDVTTAFAAMHGRLAEGSVAPYRGASDDAYDRLRVSIWTGIADKLVSPGNATLLSRQFRSLLGIGGTNADRVDRRDAEVSRWHDASGRTRVELWHVPLVGHAWSGGSFRGSHTDPRGPRASDEMMAFFLDEPRRRPQRSRRLGVAPGLTDGREGLSSRIVRS